MSGPAARERIQDGRASGAPTSISMAIALTVKSRNVRSSSRVGSRMRATSTSTGCPSSSRKWRARIPFGVEDEEQAPPNCAGHRPTRAGYRPQHDDVEVMADRPRSRSRTYPPTAHACAGRQPATQASTCRPRPWKRRISSQIGYRPDVLAAAATSGPRPSPRSRRDARAIAHARRPPRAAILSAAVPLPPLMMAPAWPMRLPGGAVCPAMKAVTGLRHLASR